MHRCTAAALACLLFTSGGNALADEQSIALGGGVHYSQGDYGTGSTTRITAFVVNGRYDSGPWTFKAGLPYLFISGNRSVVPGVGRVRDRGGLLDSTDSGLGDAVISATYAAHYNPATRFGLDLTGKLKLATADRDEGLGTGEHDFGFAVDVYKGFDRITLFAGLGYTIFGKTPDFPLDNVFNFTLGASYRVAERESVGLSYDERERVTPTAAPQRELMVYLSRRLEEGWRAQLYFLIGLADGSPDWGLGASAAYPF